MGYAIKAVKDSIYRSFLIIKMNLYLKKNDNTSTDVTYADGGPIDRDGSILYLKI